MKKIFIFIVTIAIVASCKKENKSNQPNPQISINKCSSDILSPKYGTFKICYDSLIAESRCPTGAVCIWEGAAEVKLSLHKGSDVISFKLATINNATLGLKKDTTISGITIALEDVSPYPNTQGAYNVADSKVKLRIGF